MKDKVTIKLFLTREEAEQIHPLGVARLLMGDLIPDLKQIKKTLVLTGKLKEAAELCWGKGTLDKALYHKVIHDLLALPLRQRHEYETVRREVRRKLIPRAYEVLALATPVITAAAQAQEAINQVRIREGKSRAISDFVTILEGERERLAPATFLLKYPEEHLPHVIRYLTALAIRAERGVLNLEKDRQRDQEIRQYEEKLTQLTDRGTFDPHALATLSWMIEEYRVSLFAQEVKTAFPISPKRIREKTAEIAFTGKNTS